MQQTLAKDKRAGGRRVLVPIRKSGIRSYYPWTCPAMTASFGSLG